MRVLGGADPLGEDPEPLGPIPKPLQVDEKPVGDVAERLASGRADELRTRVDRIVSIGTEYQLVTGTDATQRIGRSVNMPNT